ncbi:hypothetical protein CLCR_03995 [Cladophialophora carrionii]|uniref:F-box domain-containing protein n=1 Tax=Cladophialophora carrionii TaxID=86049 RepID=A0A1C1CJ66_9EURO|nr:hypothetical protein CLCR_03995 [Cladophialophora carrionii]
MATRLPLPKEISDLLIACREAIKKQRYEEAINSITAALHGSIASNTTVTELIGVYDYRHAAYVRQGDLDFALQDAKTMIRLDRNDVRGYLRCSSVNRMMGNLAVALQFLEQGLKHCSEADDLDILLKETQRVRDKLAAERVLTRPRDPVATLPLEVVEFIMSYLDYRQHVRMLRVSTSWKRVLSVLPPLIDTVSFVGAKTHVSSRMMRAALRRIGAPKIVRAVGLTSGASTVLQDWLHRDKSIASLEVLEISDPTIPMRTFSFRSDVLREIALDFPTLCGMEIIQEILRRCTALEYARFTTCVSGEQFPRWTLRSNTLIELDLNCEKNPAEFLRLIIDLPEIRVLSLSGFNDPQWPGDLDLRDSQYLTTLCLYDCAIRDLYLPPTVRHLRMESCEMQTERAPWPAAGPQPMLPGLDNLETLSMLYSFPGARFSEPFLPIIRQSAALTDPGHLKCLKFSYNLSSLDHFEAIIQAKWCLGLTELHIDSPNIVDRCSPFVVRSCPDLEVFHIRGAPITGVFIVDLILAPRSKLRAVTVEDCPRVHKDIIPYGEGRGVHVKFISSAEKVGKGSGRRVRELE